MKIEITKCGALNIYIPYFGWLSHCCEGLWMAGKHEDGPLAHETVYPALQDMGMSGFRLDLWESIIRDKVDQTA